MHDHINDKLVLAPSKIAGTGTFSISPIKKYDIVGLVHMRMPEGKYHVTTLGHFHNHSSDPTCINILDGQFRWLVAARDISPGEEITTDYTLQPDLEQPKDHWHDVT